MSKELHQASAEGQLEAFIASHTFPLVEGDRATFVWRGEADSVHFRNWIFGLPSAQPLQRLEGTDVWYLTFDIPEGSRVEYKFEVVRGDQHQITGDPLNPNKSKDPYGSNAVVFGTGYTTPPWVRFDPDARAGRLEDHVLHSDVFGEPRPFTMYLPARYQKNRRYPLLVVHDGVDYMRFSNLKEVLDNLIHRLEIPPMLAVMIQSPDRLREYGADERHSRYVAEELVPCVEERWPLSAEPSARCLMGASFGAVASLSTAIRYPNQFGRLLLQSGSFAFTDIGDHDRGPVFDPVVRFINAFRENPHAMTERMYLSCGVYESLIYYNRSLVPLFRESGVEVRFTESRDGHNWENWRDRLREGLSFLFPGPLWLVYE